MKLFTVYDSKAETWSNPMAFQNENVAIRSLGQVVKDRTTEIGAHPEDFSLYLIGEWSQMTGTLTPVPAKCIIKAIELEEK